MAGNHHSDGTNGFTGNAGLSLYTLLNRPNLFNAYFAASPVLSKDFAYIIKDAPKKLAAMKGKPRFLLMSTSDSCFELLFNDYHEVLKADSEISSQGAQAILEHYRYLSEDKYGFEVPATDSLIALAIKHEQQALDNTDHPFWTKKYAELLAKYTATVL